MFVFGGRSGIGRRELIYIQFDPFTGSGTTNPRPPPHYTRFEFCGPLKEGQTEGGKFSGGYRTQKDLREREEIARVRGELIETLRRLIRTHGHDGEAEYVRELKR